MNQLITIINLIAALWTIFGLKGIFEIWRAKNSIPRKNDIQKHKLEHNIEISKTDFYKPTPRYLRLIRSHIKGSGVHGRYFSINLGIYFVLLIIFILLQNYIFNTIPVTGKPVFSIY